MHSVIFVALLCCGFFTFGNSAKLPDFVNKCTKGPDFDKCAMESANLAIKKLFDLKGYPKFKMQNINELHADRVIVENGDSIKIFLDSVSIIGAGSFRVTDLKMDDNELFLIAKGPLLQVVGKYDISGRILVLPINGNGDINITFVEPTVEYRGKLHLEERKGKKYYKVENDETTTNQITAVKRIYFRLDNLFNGDERLGPEMNRFLNDNWPEVFEELRKPIEKTCAYVIINSFVNGFFLNVPIEDLYNQ